MLTELLPARLRPAAKAVAAAAVPLVAAVIAGVVTGKWDTVAITGGLTSVATALLVYRTPNAE